MATKSMKAFMQLSSSEAKYVASGKEEQLIVDGPQDGNLNAIAFVLTSNSEFIAKFGKLELTELGLRNVVSIFDSDFDDFSKTWRCQFSGYQKSFYGTRAIESIEMPCSEIEWVNTELRRIGTAVYHKRHPTTSLKD